MFVCVPSLSAPQSDSDLSDQSPQCENPWQGSASDCAGLVPITALAGQRGLAALADEHLSVPNDKGAKPGSGCRNGRYGGMWSHGESISLGDESLELMCATVPRRLVAVSSWSGYL